MEANYIAVFRPCCEYSLAAQDQVYTYLCNATSEADALFQARVDRRKTYLKEVQKGKYRGKFMNEDPFKLDFVSSLEEAYAHLG